MLFQVKTTGAPASWSTISVILKAFTIQFKTTRIGAITWFHSGVIWLELSIVMMSNITKVNIIWVIMEALLMLK